MLEVRLGDLASRARSLGSCKRLLIEIEPDVFRVGVIGTGQVTVWLDQGDSEEQILSVKEAFLSIGINLELVD